MEVDKTVIRPRPGGRVAEAAPADEDRTVIRPRPGGSGNSAADATIVRPRRKGAKPLLVLRQAATFGRNPLVDAGATLLSLATQLSQLHMDVDVEQLHRQAVEQVHAFQRRLVAAEVVKDRGEQATYLLCSLIDEMVLNTSWGEHSSWSQRGLLSRFFQQTSGGERVFTMIDEAMGAIRKDHDFLELAYLCLSLGFEGKYRVDAGGKERLEQIRLEIYQVLHEARDHYRQELSPSAEPVEHIKRSLDSFLSVWVMMAVLSLLGFALFSYLLIDLNKRSDLLQTELVALVEPAAPMPAATAIRPEVLGLRQALAPEIERGILHVEDYPNRVSIVLNAEELFGSGSTAIVQSYQPVLDKISKALESINGQILVSGHTDSSPIRTPQYPSNWHLSLARASSVVKYMASAGDLTGRLLPEGRADTEPVGDNETTEGRARNRRVVVDLFYGKS